MSSPATALLLDDLDGDDFVDLILASEEGLQVRWADAMGVPIDGSPIYHVLATELSGAVSLAAGNIDFDLDREFLAVWRATNPDETGKIRVFDHSWNRQFAATMTEDVGLMLGPNTGELFHGSGRPRALLEDLDGDGFDDLLYVDAPALELGAYGDHRVVARTSCGDGTFGPARVLFSHAGRITDVSVVDFSGDALMDLLVYSDLDGAATLLTLEQQ